MLTINLPMEEAFLLKALSYAEKDNMTCAEWMTTRLHEVMEQIEAHKDATDSELEAMQEAMMMNLNLLRSGEYTLPEIFEHAAAEDSYRNDAIKGLSWRDLTNSDRKKLGRRFANRVRDYYDSEFAANNTGPGENWVKVSDEKNSQGATIYKVIEIPVHLAPDYPGSNT